MPRLPLLLALAALTLSACDSNDPAPLPDTPDLLPLDVGNRWITDFTRTDVEGNVTEQTVDTLTVVHDTTIAGERWFRIEGTLNLSRVPAGWYTNREDGVWKWQDLESDEAYLIYQYPADVGATYAIPGRSGFVVTVADTDFPVETPDGTVSGYLYEWDTDEAYGFPVGDGEGRIDRVMVPGQGFAFIGCAYLGDGDEDGSLSVNSRFDWELISFEAAP